jgi:hypothetical protein
MAMTFDAARLTLAIGRCREAARWHRHERSVIFMPVGIGASRKVMATREVPKNGLSRAGATDTRQNPATLNSSGSQAMRTRHGRNEW